MKSNQINNLMKNLDEIEGMIQVNIKPHIDERGAFLRLYDEDWFGNSKQVNTSFNPSYATLRGMHYQIDGDPEHKLISVISGSIFFVVVDLRRESKTYLNKFISRVNANSYTSYFVPAGCANGWLTLTENTLIHYTMFSRYENNNYSGFKYNDPFFSIEWPLRPKIISKKDSNWPNFESS